MADGTNINIRLAATGADAAAAEIAKPARSINELEKELREATAAFKAAAAGSDEFVAASKRLEVAKNDLTAATGRVTKSGVQMGTGMQNVGYQVQDLAVQIGSGTSAFRAMGQQLPQLLSGFGPIGITLGTISAVALPLAGAMFHLGEKTEEAGDKAKDAEEKMEKLADTRKKKAAEAAALDMRAFREGLEDETIAYKRQNDEIQRGIELIQAKRRAQAELDSEDAALALAKIDASDAPEEKKIEQRAAINDDLERKRFRDREADAKDRVTEAANRSNAAQGNATLGFSKLDAEKQLLEEKEAEAQALKNRITESDRAAASSGALENQLADLKSQKRGEVIAATQSGSPALIEGVISKFDKLIGPLESQIKEIKTGVIASEADREALKALQGDDGTGGSNKELRESILKLSDAAKLLEEAARGAKRDFETTREKEKTGIEIDFKATTRRLERSSITSGSAADKAREEAKKKREAEEEKEAGKADKRDIGDREGRLNASAREKGLGMRKTKGAEANDTYKEVEQALLDGTNSGELQKLGDKVREAASKNGAATTSFLLQIIDGFNQQAKEIEILKQKIRNK